MDKPLRIPDKEYIIVTTYCKARRLSTLPIKYDMLIANRIALEISEHLNNHQISWPARFLPMRGEYCARRNSSIHRF
jgi:hypothetical protein